MLLFRGSFLPAPMKRTRVTENEILAAVREAGLADLAQVEAVVLETDGELSVIKQFTGDNNSSLSDVRSPF